MLPPLPRAWTAALLLLAAFSSAPFGSMEQRGPAAPGPLQEHALAVPTAAPGGAAARLLGPPDPAGSGVEATVPEPKLLPEFPPAPPAAPYDAAPLTGPPRVWHDAQAPPAS